MLNMRSVILIIFQLRGMKLQSSKPGDRTTNRVKKKTSRNKEFCLCVRWNINIFVYVTYIRYSSEKVKLL